MSHQDLKVVVLRGKNPSVRPSSAQSVKKDGFSNTLNAASLESRIDDGKITSPSTVPRDICELIKNSRLKNEAIKTQANLAMRCNFLAKDIADMENGTMVLTHANKLKIRKVQQVLGIPKFNL